MSAMLRFLEDPNARHAMLVHIPVTLAALGVIPAVALALSRFKNVTLKWLCVIWFVVAAFGAALAANSGEAAEEQIERSIAMSPLQEAALDEHADLGENGWIWPGLTALVFLGTFIPKKHAAPIAGAIGVAASVGVLAWISVTGHAGGKLVYQYGLGAPSPGLSADASTTPPILREHDDD